MNTPSPLRHHTLLPCSTRSAITPCGLTQSWVVQYRISHRRCTVFDELYNRCLYLIASSQWQFNLQHLSEISGYFWNNRHDFSSPSHHDSLYPFSLTHISFLVIVFSLLLILFSLFGSLCSLSQSSLLLSWTHDSLFYFCFSTVSPFVLAILALCLGLC